MGNVPMEMVLLNLAARGEMQVDLGALTEYCEDAGRALDWQIPPNHPLRVASASRSSLSSGANA